MKKRFIYTKSRIVYIDMYNYDDAKLLKKVFD